MATVLTHYTSPHAFNMASSPVESPLDANELPFVDASEQPLSEFSPVEMSQAPVTPFSWTTDPTARLSNTPNKNGLNHKKHKSLALPEFSFNPGAATETADQRLSSPESPNHIPSQSGPAQFKHGHRRTRSELPGVEPHKSPVVASALVSGKPTELQPSDCSNLSVTPSARPGHKHRRSAAVSKDLTGVSGPSAFSFSNGNEDTNLLSAGPPLGSAHIRTDSHHTSKSSSPVRVSFAENVDVIPSRSLPTLKPSSLLPASRPAHSSDGIQSRPERPGIAARAATYQPIASQSYFEARSEESLGDFPSVSIVEHDNHELLPFAFDDAPVLSENFDDDPTSAVENLHQRSVSQPYISSNPRIDVESASDSGVMIDLDGANDVEESAAVTAEDLRNLRAKSFSAARHSMHSGGFDNSTIRPKHIRSESEPSPSLPFFERPQLPKRTETADTASQKGFEMDNVFEEDEEELEDARREEEHFRLEARRKSEQFGLGLGIGSSFPTDQQAKRSSVIISEGSDSHDTPTPTNERDIPSRTQTIRQAASNRQSLVLSQPPTEEVDESGNLLLPADEMLASGSRLDSFDVERYSNYDSVTGVPVAPWLQQQDISSYGSTPNDPSHSSAWSTPKLDTAATSVSESAHLGLPRFQGDSYTASNVSTDGIPSLISSASTTSGIPPYTDDTPSPTTPSGTQSRNSRLSIRSQAERRRKRSSIVSLSQLMTMSRPSGLKSSLNVEQIERCQTSGGLSSISSSATPTQAKEKKRTRLSRALKFWRPKEDMETG